MRFIEFIQGMPPQQDEGINAFINWAKAHPLFPTSSDPNKLAEFLYDKLNHKMTLGYQKCFMVFANMPVPDSGEDVPAADIPVGLLMNQQKMLEAINKIVALQNADRNYRDF